ncbi:MAG: metallophosphoesterase [Treponema sp.]|nr:metallophosphoesterase [Treponema sp.]
MKILCVSDKIDPLVYSASVKDRFADVDLILSAGDLPLEYLDFIISSLNKPLLFVFGNHHTAEMKYFRRSWNSSSMEALKEFPGCGAVHLGSKVVIEDNFIVAGLGGSIRYNKGENQFSDFGMFMEIVKIIPRLLWNRVFHGRFVDILLTHAPPKGIHDRNDKCHNGFKIYLWFMKVFKPRYLVHGHIHLYDLSDVRCTKWKNTTVVNAYSHFIIDAGENIWK